MIKYVWDLVTMRDTGIVFIRERWFLCGVVVRKRLTQVK